MFSLFNAYRTMIVSTVTIMLIIGLYFYIHSLKSQISDLQSSLKDSQVEIANYKLESSRLRNVLAQQSEKIEALKSDKQNALKTLAKWKELPPKVKYKTITKIREVKSDECEDIKNQLDAIKRINFSSL